MLKSGKGKARLRPPTSKNKKPPIPVPYVEFNLKTWVKDSHGLFDYEAEAHKCDNQTFQVTKSSKIYRHISSLRTRLIDDEDPRQMPIEDIYLGTVIVNRQTQTFKIQSAAVSGVLPDPLIREAHPDLFHNSFLVLKDFEKDEGHEGYPLVPGNVIKLGRVQYVVLEVRDKKKTQTFKETSHLELNISNHVVDQQLTGSCKICLCEESPEDDPLINPCTCKGSCEFIHVGCLKNWINSKVKKELNQIVTSYNFSKFQCQICKAPFPKIVTMPRGNEIDMITIDKPDRPYIILESVNGKQQKKQRNLHLISPDEGSPLKIGRGHQCEIRVTDISVSRIHAQIRFENQKFYLRDAKSKFGTLVKFKQQFDVSKQKVKLQYGRVCMSFKICTQAPKQQSDTNEEDDYFY